MRELRSSVIFLGALLARCGEARLSMPGGCELGPRPIDLHLMALRALGADIEERGGELICSAPEGLRGAAVALPLPSVGATENAMLCACAAEGETVIMNAAREPEIGELQAFFAHAGRGRLRRGQRDGARPRAEAAALQGRAPHNARQDSVGDASRRLRGGGGRGGAAGRAAAAFFHGIALAFRLRM